MLSTNPFCARGIRVARWLWTDIKPMHWRAVHVVMVGGPVALIMLVVAGIQRSGEIATSAALLLLLAAGMLAIEPLLRWFERRSHASAVRKGRLGRHANE